MVLESVVRSRAGASLVALSTGITALLFSASAHAERYAVYAEGPEPHSALDVAVDAEGAVPTATPRSPSGSSVSGGSGFKIRVGDQIRVPGLRITPEGGYAFDHLFATDDAGPAYAWDVHRLFGGIRLAFGRFVTPGVYGHVGYGWRDTGDPTIAQAGGLALDAGFTLDFHVIPHFGFGAHAEYATVDAQPYTPQWVALGLHADLAL